MLSLDSVFGFGELDVQEVEALRVELVAVARILGHMYQGVIIDIRMVRGLGLVGVRSRGGVIFGEAALVGVGVLPPLLDFVLDDDFLVFPFVVLKLDDVRFVELLGHVLAVDGYLLERVGEVVDNDLLFVGNAILFPGDGGLSRLLALDMKGVVLSVLVFPGDDFGGCPPFFFSDFVKGWLRGSRAYEVVVRGGFRPSRRRRRVDWPTCVRRLNAGCSHV